MQTITSKPAKQKQLPLNWKQESDRFSGDHLIEAYLKGKQDGRNEMY